MRPDGFVTKEHADKGRARLGLPELNRTADTSTRLPHERAWKRPPHRTPGKEDDREHQTNPVNHARYAQAVPVHAHPIGIGLTISLVGLGLLKVVACIRHPDQDVPVVVDDALGDQSLGEFVGWSGKSQTNGFPLGF